MSFVDKIDAKVKEKSILKHPFYQKWREGKLSNKVLREYAKQYYKHVSAFPQYLSAVHAQMENQEERRMVLQNLIDEESGEKNHPELWLRFGEALGEGRKNFESVYPTLKTSEFVNNFKKYSKSSVAEGIAALYAYESQIPGVSEEKIKGLKEFYEVNGERGLEYFAVHMQADVEHSAAERFLLEKMAVDEEAEKRMMEAVNCTLDAYWNMLSGIEELSKEE